MISFNTITDLKSYNASSLSDGQLAKVAGYHSIDDGGGGDFWFDRNSNNVGNEVTIFDANGGAQLSWRRLIANGIMTPEMGGAGDGGISDLQAINLVIQYAKVLVLRKIYVINADTVFPRNLTLRFEGFGTLRVLKKATLTINARIEASTFGIFECQITRTKQFRIDTTKGLKPRKANLFMDTIPSNCNVVFGQQFQQKIQVEWFGDPFDDVGEPINKAFLAGHLGGSNQPLVMPGGILRMKTPVQIAPQNSQATAYFSLEGKGGSPSIWGAPWGSSKTADPWDVERDGNPSKAVGTVIDCRGLAEKRDAIRTYSQWVAPEPLPEPENKDIHMIIGDLHVSLNGFHLAYARKNGIRIDGEGDLKFVNQVYVSCAAENGWLIVAPYSCNIVTAGAEHCNRSGLVALHFRTAVIGTFLARENGRLITLDSYKQPITIPAIDISWGQASTINNLHIESNYSSSLHIKDSEALTISALYLENNDRHHLLEIVPGGKDCNKAKAPVPRTDNEYDVWFEVSSKGRWNNISILAVNENRECVTKLCAAGWILDGGYSYYRIAGRVPHNIFRLRGLCHIDFNELSGGMIDLYEAHALTTVRMSRLFAQRIISCPKVKGAVLLKTLDLGNISPYDALQPLSQDELVCFPGKKQLEYPCGS
jgi:hypothetical protein